MRTYTYIIVVILWMALPTQAFMQDSATSVKIDISRLQLLYEHHIADAEDTFTKQLIADERDAIRDSIEDELNKTISPVLEEEYLDEIELTKAVDRQRKVIAALQERLSDRKVDLQLHTEEEKRYYLQVGTASGAGLNKFRLTKNYPELLAKKAVFEERIAVLSSLIALQESRLLQLVRYQRLQQFQVAISIGKYLLIILGVLLLERIIRTVLLTRITNVDTRYTATKFFTAFVYVSVFLWILGVLLSKQPSILASLAIVGAGLAIALQDVVKDILGWFIVVQNRLFTRGHRISVGDTTGEVIDFGLLRTVLLEIGIPKNSSDAGAVLERTGKVLSLPNHVYLTKSLTNHTTTSDFVRSEMRITITFESNWRMAQEICKKIIDDITSEFVERDQKQSRYRMQMLYLPHRTAGNQVYIDVASDGVELTLRFTVPIGERRPITSQISDAILQEFSSVKDIDLAYTTQRILMETDSGKSKE